MKRLILSGLAILSIATLSQAQNVGIAEAAPNSKLDIVQTEATGNTIEANHNITTNASSAVWIRNLGTNRALHAQNLSNTSNIHVARFLQLGNGAAADGILVEMDAVTAASTSGLFINNNGLGFGGYALLGAANTNPAWVADHAGSGQGLFISQSGTGDGIYNDVAGGAGIINVVGNNNIGILNNMSAAGGTGGYSYMAANNGTGYYVLGTNNPTTPSLGAGGDVYAFFANVNTATPTAAGTVYGSVLAGNQFGPGHGVLIAHSGNTGRNAEFNITNPNNPDEAIFSIHNGQGSVIVGQNQNNALAATIAVADFSYTGSDVDDHIGVVGSSAPAAWYGIGVQGTGNWYGVEGVAGSSGIAVFGTGGDVAATGVKSFYIDYPLDPANKFLRHYAIESNEVLNMYRGIVELDANGQATVQLPEYFEAINKDYSYQLTAIGTPQHPYILEEITNNEFKVAGAPNTKVSWVVHAKRNDPYVQKNKEKLVDITEKPDNRKGTYLTPELYNQPKSKGMTYRANKKATATTATKLPSSSIKNINATKKELPKKSQPKEDKLESDVTSTNK